MCRARAHLCHGNTHFRLRDCVHWRAHDWDSNLNVARDIACQIHLHPTCGVAIMRSCANLPHGSLGSCRAFCCYAHLVCCEGNMTRMANDVIVCIACPLIKDSCCRPSCKSTPVGFCLALLPASNLAAKSSARTILRTYVQLEALHGRQWWPVAGAQTRKATCYLAKRAVFWNRLARRQN